MGFKFIVLRGFPHFLSFRESTLICKLYTVKNEQLDEWKCQICTNVDIKKCNNDNMGMKSAYLCFNDFPLSFFLIFENTQIMQIR